MFGIDRIQTGEMIVEGKPVSFKNPRRSDSRRFCFTPENRKHDGIIPHLSIRENIVVSVAGAASVMKAISRKQQDEIVDKFIKVLASARLVRSNS